VTRQVNGYANVLNLVDLAWVTGKLTKPGCGVNALPEEANEQGAVDMGVAPELLPGQAPYADAAARARFASAWNAALPAGPGAPLMEMLDRCRRGEIKALYLVGENPLATLPACTFAEKDGTFTNLEGKMNRVRPALDPYEDAHPDWEIFAALGGALGCPMDYDGPQAVQREIMKLLPGYYNLGEAKPPAADPAAYLRNGYARAVAARYAAGAEPAPPARPFAEADRPFALTIGQVLYHSGKLSTRASGLVQLSPSKGRLQMNQADLARLQVGAHDAVRVTSARGAVELRTEANPDLAPGTCFFPEHFNEPPVKDLADCVVDAVTGVPAFKFVRVSIAKV